MIFKKGMSLIITIVNSGFSQQVVDASKKAGAEGATILSGRGTSRNETTSVLGVQIQPEKEMVMILVRKSFRKDIMKQIVRACDLTVEGKGLVFCLPVDEVAGVNHMFKNGVFKRGEFVETNAKQNKSDEKCEQETKPEKTAEKESETKSKKENEPKPEKEEKSKKE